jgi:hypothetical protein
MRVAPKKEEADDAGWGRPRGPLVEPGEYVVSLEAAGKKLTRKAHIKGRRGWAIGPQTVPIK